MWGTCTTQKNECVKEGEVDLCRFGWEKTYVLFGERYCVTAERSAYNQI
jgi:hypothetical protein